MRGYVNHQAIGESFLPLELEDDPVRRSDLIGKITSEFTTRLADHLGRTAFELCAAGWTLSQTADELGQSVNVTRRLIADHARKTKKVSPLRSQRVTEAVDISRLVRAEAVLRQP
jgi:hypothetical protein